MRAFGKNAKGRGARSCLLVLPHVGVTKTKLSRKSSAPLTYVMWGLFTLVVLGRGAPLWKANQPIEQGVVMEGGNSSSLGVLEFRSCDICNSLLLPTLPGSCFH